ncbi:MAG: PAS domain S-box protein, partial [Nitrospira sp.]|nr:PAS domain S-box protein [Nitrospira sp.]
GLNLVATLKGIRSSTLCVMVTAYATMETAIQALQEGAYDYLRKPLNGLDLLATLDRCFEKLRLEREKTLAEDALKARNQELEEINARLQQIIKSTKGLAACSLMQELGPILLEEFARNMAAEGGSLFLCKEDRLILAHTLDSGHTPQTILFPLPRDSVFERAIRENEPILIRDIAQEEEAIKSGWEGYKDGSLLVFPIADKAGKTIGLISLHNKTWPPFTHQDRELGAILASFSCEALRATQAVERLAASEKRFREMAELLPNVIYEMNTSLKLTYANRAAFDVFGYAEEDVAEGLQISQFLAEKEFEKVQQFLENQGQGVVLPPITCTAKRKDKSNFPCEMSAAPIVDLDGAILGFRGVIHDITELKRLEEQLRQSQKMEAIGRLVGGIAHDFNNLLTGIISYAQLLKLGFSANDPRTQDLTQILELAYRAAGLIRQLLLFSRRQSLDPIVFNINTLVENISKMLRRLIG